MVGRGSRVIYAELGDFEHAYRLSRPWRNGKLVVEHSPNRRVLNFNQSAWACRSQASDSSTGGPLGAMGRGADMAYKLAADRIGVHYVKVLLANGVDDFDGQRPAFFQRVLQNNIVGELKVKMV
jgi:hypothetical protein